MDKPAKILIGGIVIGALTYGLGALNAHRLEHKVQQLQNACVAEKDAEEKKQGPWSALAGIFIARPTCDPATLARSNDYTGIQAQLAAAECERQAWGNWPSVVAIVIAVMSCLPWLWYFFLRRIRELREAITGKK